MDDPMEVLVTMLIEFRTAEHPAILQTAHLTFVDFAPGFEHSQGMLEAYEGGAEEMEVSIWHKEISETEVIPENHSGNLAIH